MAETEHPEVDDVKKRNRTLILPLVLGNLVTSLPILITTLLLIEISQSFNVELGIANQVRAVESTASVLMGLLMSGLAVRYRHKSLFLIGLGARAPQTDRFLGAHGNPYRHLEPFIENLTNGTYEYQDSLIEYALSHGTVKKEDARNHLLKAGEECSRASEYEHALMTLGYVRALYANSTYSGKPTGSVSIPAYVKCMWSGVWLVSKSVLPRWFRFVNK